MKKDERKATHERLLEQCVSIGEGRGIKKSPKGAYVSRDKIKCLLLSTGKRIRNI